MSKHAVTPLRHRMIEDMNARKLCAGTQKGPHCSSRSAGASRHSIGYMQRRSCHPRRPPHSIFQFRAK